MESQLGDEDDEDDPFAQLEEGFDEMGRYPACLGPSASSLIPKQISKRTLHAINMHAYALKSRLWLALSKRPRQTTRSPILPKNW